MGLCVAKWAQLQRSPLLWSCWKPFRETKQTFASLPLDSIPGEKWPLPTGWECWVQCDSSWRGSAVKERCWTGSLGWPLCVAAPGSTLAPAWPWDRRRLRSAPDPSAGFGWPLTLGLQWEFHISSRRSCHDVPCGNKLGQYFTDLAKVDGLASLNSERKHNSILFGK